MRDLKYLCSTKKRKRGFFTPTGYAVIAGAIIVTALLVVSCQAIYQKAKEPVRYEGISDKAMQAKAKEVENSLHE